MMRAQDKARLTARSLPPGKIRELGTALDNGFDVTITENYPRTIKHIMVHTPRKREQVGDLIIVEL